MRNHLSLYSKEFLHGSEIAKGGYGGFHIESPGANYCTCRDIAEWSENNFTTGRNSSIDCSHLTLVDVEAALPRPPSSFADLPPMRQAGGAGF